MIEYVTVPLVIYDEDGERRVIGEATVKGAEIMAVLSEEAAEEIVDMLEMGVHDFSIKPFKKTKKKDKSKED